MKIRLVMLGKTRRPELRAVLDDYLARVVLAEQLYRAFATLAGSPYPK